MALANDGLYREARHFTAWPKKMQVETYYLEAIIEKVTGQHTVPIGDAILSTLDTAVGCETCEELFTPSNPSTYMGLNVSAYLTFWGVLRLQGVVALSVAMLIRIRHVSRAVKSSSTVPRPMQNFENFGPGWT